MVTMPHGPRRRRREKKLMTMEEVNERFPLLKYKAWMTSRAAEGLSTAGGVAAPSASRAASLRNAEGAIGRNERNSSDSQRPVTPAAKESMDQHGQSPDTTQKSAEPQKAEDSKEPDTAKKDTPNEDRNAGTSGLTPSRTNDTSIAADDLDDDDQIQTAVPTEMLATPGDSCAICIDTLEDDDDVRGLSCGHAFHASCLDPWLTSRRACCPLCKADYYVPKPRPEGEAAADAERQSGRRAPGQRSDMPRPPQYAFFGGNARRQRLLPARFMLFAPQPGGNQQAPQDQRQSDRMRHQAATLPPTPGGTDNAQQQTPNGDRERRFNVPHFSLPRPRIAAPSFLRRNQPAQTGTAAESGTPEVTTTTTTTPAQLEAGQRQS